MRETIADLFRRSEARFGEGYLPGVWEDAVCWVMNEVFWPAVPFLLLGCLAVAAVCWLMIAVGAWRERGSESDDFQTAGSENSLPGRDVGPGGRELRPAAVGAQLVRVDLSPEPFEDESDVFDGEWDRE